MLNDHIINDLRFQHREELIRAAENDRLLHELRGSRLAESNLPSGHPVPVGSDNHRVRIFFWRTARKEVVVYRGALCHCILEQFRLGAISIEEAERRLSQLW